MIALEELELIESVDGFQRLCAMNQCVLHLGSGFVTLLRENDENAAADVLRSQLLLVAAEMLRLQDDAPICPTTRLSPSPASSGIARRETTSVASPQADRRRRATARSRARVPYE